MMNTAISFKPVTINFIYVWVVISKKGIRDYNFPYAFFPFNWFPVCNSLRTLYFYLFPWCSTINNALRIIIPTSRRINPLPISSSMYCYNITWICTSCSLGNSSERTFLLPQLESLPFIET